MKGYYLACFNQWLHCLLGMFRGCRSTAHFFDYNFGLHRMYFRLGCECGKRFWLRDNDERYQACADRLDAEWKAVTEARLNNAKD